MPIYSFQSERSGDDSDEDDLPLRKAGKKGKNHLLLSKKKAKKSSSNDDDGNPVANGAKKKLSMLFGRRRYERMRSDKMSSRRADGQPTCLRASRMAVFSKVLQVGGWRTLEFDGVV